MDNGVEICQHKKDHAYKYNYTSLFSRVSRLNPIWFLKSSKNQDDLFLEAMEIAKEEFLEHVMFLIGTCLLSQRIVKASYDKKFEVDPSG